MKRPEDLEPDYSAMICVTHWRICEAYRREPYTRVGFHLCPIDEAEGATNEHLVVPFVAKSEWGENP
jgi:hypothetical protein